MSSVATNTRRIFTPSYTRAVSEAGQFDINYANVSYIVRRKTWAHVGEAV